LSASIHCSDMFSPGFFLVLDRLHGTLFEKLDTWKTHLQTLEDSIFVWDRVSKLRTLWGERMRVMKDLAGALSYLHDLRIIYRDLKPENCGFDALGNVKLFDFGLAREVHDDDDCGNGTYKLTPNTGSLRYMAPENGNKWPYNFLADSFSFGILLWEVAALERPYNCFAPKEIRDMVMKWGERPKTKDGWSERMVELMTSSWDSNFRKRPKMKVIEATLQKEIDDYLI
jgi:serine/threonine protein kinase